MSWATIHIDNLKNGLTVKFRPQGGSMKGRIESGQLCTLVPADTKPIQIDDIVLCKVKGVPYLHIVFQIIGDQYLIGNNLGRMNGWTPKSNIYGIVTKIEK